MTRDEDEFSGVDPEEFLRALLQISPEDAAEVREEAARKMKRGEHQKGPSADHGDDE